MDGDSDSGGGRASASAGCLSLFLEEVLGTAAAAAATRLDAIVLELLQA